ncbi:alpha/beta fold hydrolase [Janibacter cremeus]|uniref:Pimeloyl-ACP methyl ester carboxylesterase n=1 Tax=Janibacter cremeus TaxID=1285192 RepID=A0A852VXP6_9MICO|nr:alpha/beta hydrolase [Janibacter cremeus]NYF99433.1 pimeloyl-ACP methyl ester carboxylesterase [Janibacter cremeus]
MTAPGAPIRLLLVHGSRLNAAAWIPLEEILLGRIVCEHIDLPGHGLQQQVPFTMEGAIAAVGDAVEALDASRHRIVLGGHSLGGYVAMEWAARNHGVLAGLVLMGSTAQPSSRLAGVYRAFGSALRAGLEDVRRAESLRETDAASLRRIIGARTAAAVLQRGPGLEAIPDAWDAVINEVDLKSLAEVDVPVLAINGEYDQFRVGEGTARALRHDLEVVHIPGATHFAPMTHAAPVATAIRSFAASLPA